MIYLQLFYTFFKIGLFGFGGGYAMLSLIQGEMVSTPRVGKPSGIYRHRSHQPNDARPHRHQCSHLRGIHLNQQHMGFAASRHFAVILPSFILMLTISKFFLKYQKHPVVESVFNGLRPAVVGLLASAALVLMNRENFGSPTEDTYSFVISLLLFLVTFIGTFKYKANSILMIIGCGLAKAILLY